jgi:hypothetical protein
MARRVRHVERRVGIQGAGDARGHIAHVLVWPVAEHTAHGVFRVPKERPVHTPLIRNLCILSTQCIYEFPLILRMNSDNFAYTTFRTLTLFFVMEAQCFSERY